MKNKYMVCMMAFLGLGLVDLFYLNSQIIPALWSQKTLTAETQLGQLSPSGIENAAEPTTTAQPDVFQDHPAAESEFATTSMDQDQVPGDTAAAADDRKVEPEFPAAEVNTEAFADSAGPASEENIHVQPTLLRKIVVGFESSARELTRQEQRKLLAELEELPLDETIRVNIDGHTDQKGTGKFDNELLSRQRAEYVADIFKAQGISESYITVKGHGDSQPLDDDETPEALAKNRRAEIKIFEDEP